MQKFFTNTPYFADDLMVFSDGTKILVEGVISVFNEFARCLRLKIKQLKLFRAGTSQNISDEILLNFPFEVGSASGTLGITIDDQRHEVA